MEPSDRLTGAENRFAEQDESGCIRIYSGTNFTNIYGEPTQVEIKTAPLAIHYRWSLIVRSALLRSLCGADLRILHVLEESVDSAHWKRTGELKTCPGRNDIWRRAGVSPGETSRSLARLRAFGLIELVEIDGHGRERFLLVHPPDAELVTADYHAQIEHDEINHRREKIRLGRRPKKGTVAQGELNFGQ